MSLKQIKLLEKIMVIKMIKGIIKNSLTNNNKDNHNSKTIILTYDNVSDRFDTLLNVAVMKLLQDEQEDKASEH